MYNLQKRPGFSQDDAEELKEALKTLFEMMHLRQDQKEVWKCVECIGGKDDEKHRQFPVERFREDLQLKKE